MHSTKSTLLFVLAMTTIVAVVLAGMSTGLKSIHDKNEALYAKKATLSAVADHLGMDFSSITNEQVIEVFNSQIEQLVLDAKGNVVPQAQVNELYKGGLAENIDLGKEFKKPGDEQLYPLYIYTKKDGSKYYILSARGKGLWDAIWGCIALKDDLNTIAGVAFDHKAETPGLGAEIKDNPSFKKQFIGKKLYENGAFRSVFVRKGGAKDPVYEVDGISGATITADGVTEMLKRGLKYYEPYLKTVKG